MTTIWVATASEPGSNARAQACDSRESALVWLASTIDQDEWEHFFDALPEGERTGMTRNVSDMDALTAIEAWIAPDGDDSWGNDMLSFTVTEQDIFTGAK
jgi:hypothetical protein